MPNPQLTAYIQGNLSKFSKEVVIQSLSSAGWSAVDISAAFMALEHPAPPAPTQVAPAPVVAEPAQQRPIGSAEPRPAVASASATNPNETFLAEMEKRRKEADMVNPQGVVADGVRISSGYTQNTVVTQTGLVGMVMKTGLVKNEQQANMVLIGIIVVCLGLAAWFTLG